MPWKECNQMDERLRLVAKLLDGEKMAAVCRELGIPVVIRPNRRIDISIASTKLPV
jgi:hypothetical protein